MELSELRSAPHLSASSIGDYVECSLLYKLGRVDRLPMEQKPDAMLFGTCIHKVMEEYYLEKMSGHRLLLKEIHQVFETTWTKLAENRTDIKYSAGKDFKALFMLGKDLLSVWYNKLPDDNFRVLAIEEPFSCILSGIPVPIIGAMDLVEEDDSGTVIITDFKTSARAYSAGEIDQNQQLTIYQIAAKKNGFAGREILLKFDTFIKTKTVKFEQYWTTRSDIDERRLITKVKQVWDGISKQVYVPNDTSWKCKNCSYNVHSAPLFMVV